MNITKFGVFTILSIFLMVVIVSAAGENAKETNKPDVTGINEDVLVEKEVKSNGIDVETNKPNTSEIKEQFSKEREVKSNVTGLENAILRVKNNETVAHLEEVFTKIQEKRRTQLAKLEELQLSKDEKTNKTIIEGKGKAKFLGFIPVQKNYQYEVDENGELVKHKKFFDFMFKKEDPIDAS